MHLKWYLSVILICIFTNEVEYLFVYLLASLIVSFVKLVSCLLAVFLLGCLFSLLVISSSTLCLIFPLAFYVLTNFNVDKRIHLFLNYLRFLCLA